MNNEQNIYIWPKNESIEVDIQKKIIFNSSSDCAIVFRTKKGREITLDDLLDLIDKVLEKT